MRELNQGGQRPPKFRDLPGTLLMVTPRLLDPKVVGEGVISDQEPCLFLRSHSLQANAAGKKHSRGRALTDVRAH